MKEDKKEIVDLLTDESFINYCKNTSPEDVAFWENYITQNPERRELVELARERFLMLFNALAIADREEQALRLKNRLNQKEAAPVIKMEERKEVRKQKTFLLPKIAAAACLLIAALFTVKYFSNPDSKGTRTFTAAYGERKNIQLPDGSVVNLNAGSEIKIDGNFGVSARNVYLEGEAFFDVKHNERNPFIVHTPAMDVKAIGTAFDVKAYPGEKVTETSLIRGLAEVTLKESDNEVMLLHPNQKIVWAQQATRSAVTIPVTREIKQASLKPDAVIPQNIRLTDRGDIKEIAWKENKLIFEDDSFVDIAILLERWYGIRIEFIDDSIRNYRFTGGFEKEDLQTVLKFLKESRPFNFRIDSSETITVFLSE